MLPAIGVQIIGCPSVPEDTPSPSTGRCESSVRPESVGDYRQTSGERFVRCRTRRDTPDEPEPPAIIAQHPVREDDVTNGAWVARPKLRRRLRVVRGILRL